MGKAIEKEAATVEKAVESALFELGCAREDADIDVLQQPSSGFLGFFAKPARVRVAVKESQKEDTLQVEKAKEAAALPASPSVQERSADGEADAGRGGRTLQPDRSERPERAERYDRPERFERLDRMDSSEERTSYETRLLETNEKAVHGPLADKAETFLADVFAAMQMDVAITRSASSDGVIFNLSGENLGILIGKHGQTLDSLQYLANLAANRTHEGEHLHLILDIEDYRARRETTLMRLAGHLADKACSMGQEVHLEPMTRHERKIIHMALQGNRRVTSYSAGTEPRRYVVIVPKRRRRREDSYYERGEY